MADPATPAPGRSQPMEVIDDLLVVQRAYGEDDDGLSVGLANIKAEVPDVEANKDKVKRCAEIFRERGVNVAIFPEFCLSGYFWEDEAECRAYMDTALIERHTDWMESELQSMLDEHFRGIVLNNLTEGPDGQYLNRTLTLVTASAAAGRDYLDPENSYDKVFLPGIERTYTASGRDDRLVEETRWGRIGFTTCYDVLFGDLLREYSVVDEIDAIVQVASWRAAAHRDYPGLNVRTDHYYGDLWNAVIPAASATNQVWTIACNAVGHHPITGARFWGGSGVWAPSGLCLAQASTVNEELLIVHNLDIAGAREAERDAFNYAIDFNEIYRPLEGSRSFTRKI